MTKLALACAAASMMAHGPLETRDEPDDDPLAAATQAVEELRTGFSDYRTSSEKTIGDLRTQLKDFETRLNRPNGGNPPAEITLEQRAFTNFLRLGPERMVPDETRALVVGDDTKGGYLAPADFQAEVIKGIVELSPIRQAARVGSTSAGSVILPRLTGRPTANWVGEEEDRQETTMSYGQVEIPVHEIACYIDVSLKLLEDSAVNVESEVSFELAQEFSRKENEAFAIGDGVKKPLGLQLTPGISNIASGNATLLTPDGFISTMYSMPQAYADNGTWLMNRGTLGSVMLFKDAQNNYIWSNAGWKDGQPSTILGRPVIIDPSMPNVAAGTLPVLFGDFKRAYRIYDRVGMSILRDPYTQATKGLVRFHARRRVGGKPVLAEALRRIFISA